MFESDETSIFFLDDMWHLPGAIVNELYRVIALNLMLNRALNIHKSCTLNNTDFMNIFAYITLFAIFILGRRVTFGEHVFQHFVLDPSSGLS
jgi:hypothetical protein